MPILTNSKKIKACAIRNLKFIPLFYILALFQTVNIFILVATAVFHLWSLYYANMKGTSHIDIHGYKKPDFKNIPKNKSWVYVLYSPDLEQIKIGYSKNPSKRIAFLKNSVGSKLYLVGLYEGTMHDEQSIHGALSKYRMNGEWFSVTGIALFLLRAYVSGRANHAKLIAFRGAI